MVLKLWQHVLDLLYFLGLQPLHDLPTELLRKQSLDGLPGQFLMAARIVRLAAAWLAFEDLILLGRICPQLGKQGWYLGHGEVTLSPLP